VDEVITSPCGAMLQISFCGAQGNVIDIPPAMQGAYIMLAAIDDRRYRDAWSGQGGPDEAASASRTQSAAPMGADEFLVLRGTDGALLFVISKPYLLGP
jgi:hypothetical protein